MSEIKCVEMDVVYGGCVCKCSDLHVSDIIFAISSGIASIGTVVGITVSFALLVL